MKRFRVLLLEEAEGQFDQIARCRTRPRLPARRARPRRLSLVGVSTPKSKQGTYSGGPCSRAVCQMARIRTALRARSTL
jgi:hypothetical protein